MVTVLQALIRTQSIGLVVRLNTQNTSYQVIDYDKIKSNTGISKKEVKNVITKTFKVIEKELKENNNVMLRGYVKFVKAKRNGKASKVNWNNFKTKMK